MHITRSTRDTRYTTCGVILKAQRNVPVVNIMYYIKYHAYIWSYTHNLHLHNVREWTISFQRKNSILASSPYHILISHFLTLFERWNISIRMWGISMHISQSLRSYTYLPQSDKSLLLLFLTKLVVTWLLLPFTQFSHLSHTYTHHRERVTHLLWNSCAAAGDGVYSTGNN